MLESERFTERQTRVMALVSVGLGVLALLAFGLTLYGQGGNWMCSTAPFMALGAVMVGATCLIAGRGSWGMAWAGIILGILGHIVVLLLFGLAIGGVLSDGP